MVCLPDSAYSRYFRDFEVTGVLKNSWWKYSNKIAQNNSARTCKSRKIKSTSRYFNQNLDDEKDYSEKLIRFAVETINFWAKKLSFLPGKSQFTEAYEDLKKMKVEISKNYEYYKSEKLALGLWGDR